MKKFFSAIALGGMLISMPAFAVDYSGQAARPYSPFTMSTGNPSSSLILTSATAAYGAKQLIANNATGTSITVPSFAIGNSAGGLGITGGRLISNDYASGAWLGVVVNVDLWSTAPTFAAGSGDRSTYAPSGTSGWLGELTCAFRGTPFADGIVASCVTANNVVRQLKLASGSTVYWTAWVETASAGATGASMTMTFVPEFSN